MATLKEILKKSKGHKELIKDLELLKDMVNSGFYHDFASDLSTPKMQLTEEFNVLRNNVINGKYIDTEMACRIEPIFN